MRKLLFALCFVLTYETYAANTCGDDLDNNCWDCGKTDSDNCTARLDPDTKKLTITGDGYMRDYYTPSSWKQGNAVERPWGNDITSLEIADGIKSIGIYAFFQTKLNEINVPSSVEEIRSGAFQSITPLTNVTFAEDSQLEIIGDGVFNAVPNLTEIDIPQTVKVFGANTFNLSGINSIVLNDNLFATDYDDGENYFYGLNLKAFSDVDNIYCSEANRAKCEEYFSKAEFWERGTYYPLKEKATLNVNNNDGSVDTYQWNTDGSFAIYRDGKFLAYKGKRIYTIDEANAVAKPTGNTVRIKYR